MVRLNKRMTPAYPLQGAGVKEKSVKSSWANTPGDRAISPDVP